MKSFKNQYNRNKFLPTLQNTTFESPSLVSNTFFYFNELNQSQKNSFAWICGGNILNSSGPVIVNGNVSWNFPLPFPSGFQFVAIQANSFIQQPIYLATGSYTISFTYCSRSGSNINPIEILIDDIVMGTSPNISTSVWTPLVCLLI